MSLNESDSHIPSIEEALEEAEKPTTATPPSPPEGGLYGWLAVLGAGLTLFCTFGAALSFGAFQDYYTRDYLSNHSPSAISWIGSVQLFLDFAVGLPAGRLYDAGYFRSLMITGSVIYIFSFFMLSLAKPQQYYQVFLAQGIGMGIGMGLVIAPAVSLPSHYFKRRRSFAVGLVFAGSSCGGVVFPIMLNHLINSSLGFAWGTRATAFMVLGLLTIANLISHPRYPPKSPSAKAQASVLSLLSDIPYLISLIGSALVLWGLFFPYFYLQLFSIYRGIDQKLAFYSLTVMNAGTIVGRTLPNAVADAYGSFNVTIAMTVVTGGLMFAMLGVKDSASMFAFAALYGIFSGAFISLFAAILAGFSKSISEVGSRIGVGMFIISFAVLTGYPIDGALLHSPRYLWSHAVIFGGVVILAGVATLIISRSMAAKQRGTWRL